MSGRLLGKGRARAPPFIDTLYHGPDLVFITPAEITSRKGHTFFCSRPSITIVALPFLLRFDRDIRRIRAEMPSSLDKRNHKRQNKQPPSAGVRHVAKGLWKGGLDGRPMRRTCANLSLAGDGILLDSIRSCSVRAHEISARTGEEVSPTTIGHKKKK